MIYNKDNNNAAKFTIKTNEHPVELYKMIMNVVIYDLLVYIQNQKKISAVVYTVIVNSQSHTMLYEAINQVKIN